MRFDYRETFTASRATGYEVLLHQCMQGDTMLFSRSDLVESAWRVAQPILDAWAARPAENFPNYPAGSWGPKAAFDLIEHDGRTWLEAVNRGVIETVPLFQACDGIFQHNIAMVLKPEVVDAGDFVIRKGDVGRKMYFLVRGEVEVLDGDGRIINTLGPGSFFGETALILAAPRTASIRGRQRCDLFVLDRDDFNRVLRDHPQFAQSILEASRARYQVSLSAEQAFDRQVTAMLGPPKVEA
jgi:glucose-6-phosphate 1-dehydrogenase